VALTPIEAAVAAAIEDLQRRESVLAEREVSLVKREERAGRVDQAINALSGSLPHAVASPLDGVRNVPADGGVSNPLGPQRPVPANPGAPNRNAPNPLPNSSPLPSHPDRAV
jgi:hypothetical protein